jgi:hypothetical protein
MLLRFYITFILFYFIWWTMRTFTKLITVIWDKRIHFLFHENWNLWKISSALKFIHTRFHMDNSNLKTVKNDMKIPRVGWKLGKHFPLFLDWSIKIFADWISCHQSIELFRKQYFNLPIMFRDEGSIRKVTCLWQQICRYNITFHIFWRNRQINKNTSPAVRNNKKNSNVKLHTFCIQL